MNTTRIALLFVASLSFAACVDLGGGGDVSTRSGPDLCVDLCASKGRAGCAGFSMSACVSECEGAYRSYAACASQLDAAARCASTAQYRCDNGRPTTSACTGESLTFAACISNGAR